MGCNCNKRRIIGSGNKNDEEKSRQSIALSVFGLAGTIILKVFMVLMFVVILFPVIFYALFCMLFGKEPVINTRKMMEFANGKRAKTTGKTKRKSLSNTKANGKNQIEESRKQGFNVK